MSSAAAAASAAPSRASTTRSQPSWERDWASASPRPREAPVMIATGMVFSFFFLASCSVRRITQVNTCDNPGTPALEWPMTRVRRGGGRGWARRHRDGIRARARGACGRCCTTGPTSAGPPTRARGSCRRRRRNATTRTGSSWFAPRARTTSNSYPASPARPDGTVRDSPARDARHRRAAVGVGRGTGAGRDGDQCRRSTGARFRFSATSCAPCIIPQRRASTVG